MAKEPAKLKVEQPDDPLVVGTINLRRSQWDLLQRVAYARARKAKNTSPDGRGGRSSMSGVVQKFLDDNRVKLEKEIKENSL